MNKEINEAELGRNKNSSSPPEHLVHLLDIGWTASSLLVQKYVARFGLQKELAEWQKNHPADNSREKNSKPAAKRP